MANKLTLCILFIAISISSVIAQKKMIVQDDDLGLSVARTEDDETVVIVRSPLELSFESTMDKEVDVYNTENESGFNKYYLKFSTLPKYRGRKLKIKSHGFDTYTHELELVAKVPVGIYVFDPDGDVGVGCYFENLNKGNRQFNRALYEDARITYLNALECSDLPEDNIINQKIEDAMNCAEYRRLADDLYNVQDYASAKTEYEKVVALNGFDKHSQGRIDQCNEEIGNMPRQISGVVTDQEGAALEGVTVKAEYVKVDKKGKIQYNKDGTPKKEYKTVGKSDAGGKYNITVLNKSKLLEFSKGNFLVDKVKYKTAKVEITGDVINIALQRDLTLSESIDALDQTVKALGGEGDSK